MFNFVLSVVDRVVNVLPPSAAEAVTEFVRGILGIVPLI